MLNFNNSKASLYSFLEKIGPGILLAATAIGVSHIVQSVQAGAKYGYLFLVIIIFAHIIKYPFFAVAPKYSSITNRSLLYGYYLLNRKYLIIYLILTFLSMFTILAAVSVVSGAIISNITPFAIDIRISSILGLLCSVLLLLFGKYNLLDKSVKYIVLLLTICSIIALLIALSQPVEKEVISYFTFDFHNKSDILFLIAFLGWMPCPLDCAVWNSIWIIEKKHSFSLKQHYNNSLLDFRIGFFTAAILAIIFLMLGNLMIFSTNIILPSKGTDFIALLFEIYTNNLGSWAFIIIAIAALLTMFSTIITCLDGFSRALNKTLKLLINGTQKEYYNEKKGYPIMLLISLSGSVIIIMFFLVNMSSLILIATSISFLTTPIFAWLNLKLITNKNYPKEYHPSKQYIIICKVFVGILIIFALWFLFSRFY
jgi:Mn2+/Fe2+ NRAMP family transporter